MKTMIAIAMVLASGLCGAAGVYRWVDDQGRTHVADAVPERYRATAVRIGASQAQPPAGARSRAGPSVRREREPQVVHAGEDGGMAPDTAEPAPASAPAPDPAETECDRLWRAYFASQECFAPYHIRGGGLRPGAFEHCQQVVSPSYQCGPAQWVH